MIKMHVRLGLCLIALGATAGCATYQAEKQDLIRGGGQSQRLQAAQERQDDASAQQLGLTEDKASALEELGALQVELRAVNDNRRRQEGRLQQARSNARISPEEEARLRRQLNSLTDAFNDRALELELARSRGASDEVTRKARELQRNKDEIAAIDREIEVILQ
jgi:hypothetical protein